MRSNIADVVTAIKTVFRERRAWAEFVLASFAVFALFILIPVWTTPGNDVLFQLSILTPSVRVLMTVLALLNGLVVAMQLYIRRHAPRRERGDRKQVLTIGGLAAASLSATVACAACYSAIFAFFGLGVTTFLVNYRFEIGGFAALLALYAVLQASKRINHACAVCVV